MNPNGVHDRVICESADVALPVTPTITQQSHRNHYTQFKSYLRRNLIYIQRLVHATDQQLSDEVRTQALHTLSYAMAELDLWPLVRELLLALAPKMELGGHREDWLPYLTQGLEQSKMMGDLKTAAECHLQMGLLYRLVSNFGAAREHLVASIDLAQEIGEAHQQARSLNELAWLEQLKEEYTAAEEYVQQALTLLEDGDPEVATCYRVQGMIAFGHKDWQKAEKFHRQALKGFEQQGDLRRTAWSLQNLAYVQYGQARYKEAIELYQQAAISLEKLHDISHLSIVRTNLGLAHYQAGSLEMAIQCYRHAFTTAKELHDNLQLARILTNFGLAYLALEDYSNAELSFQQSADIYAMLANKRAYLNAIDGLSMVYLAWQQDDKAIVILERAIAILPEIADSPDYQYLNESLNKHLQQAKCSISSATRS